MRRISINLLPEEFAKVEREKNRKKWVIHLSSIMMVLVAVVTSITLGFGIFQNARDRQISLNIENIRSQINSLNENEGYLTLIKQRLGLVQRLEPQDASKLASVQFLLSLTPEGVRILSFSVEKDKEVSFSAVSDSLASLNAFFNNLIEEKNNSGKVAKLKIDSLAFNTGGSFRFDVTVVFK